jgi:hypothetical protein
VPCARCRKLPELGISLEAWSLIDKRTVEEEADTHRTEFRVRWGEDGEYEDTWEREEWLCSQQPDACERVALA